MDWSVLDRPAIRFRAGPAAPARADRIGPIRAPGLEREAVLRLHANSASCRPSQPARQRDQRENDYRAGDDEVREQRGERGNLAEYRDADAEIAVDDAVVYEGEA